MCIRDRPSEHGEFTREMREAGYTILVPNMLEFHFSLIEKVRRLNGYNAVLLKNHGPGVMAEGLKYVHNDTCVPALLVIGQFLDALHSGEYDVNKVALIITQTGGGCRASNYIYLLRQALQTAGLSQVPVISDNMSGLESASGSLCATIRPAEDFDKKGAAALLRKHMHKSLAQLGLTRMENAVCASGALLLYLEETQKNALAHLNMPLIHI